MSITRYCTELLEAAGAYHVRYGDRLANHLPMVLIALDKMGATREQLQHAFDRSVAHLERPQLAPVNREITISECRNREELLPTALDYYQRQLRQHGIAECLRRELPPLLPAIATAAFHPLIRTAYGIDANHQQEIATGLAYWNLEYRELPSSDGKVETAPEEVLPLLAKRFPLISLAPGNISDHMAAVTRQEGWLDTPLQPEQIGLENIAQIALQAYRGTGDFTLLHGITGCHALRLILEYCADKEIALRYFWSGLAIAFLSTGPKELRPTNETSQKLDWKEIHNRVCDSDDDHVIKLAYSCEQEWRHYQTDGYQAVASKLVRSD